MPDLDELVADVVERLLRIDELLDPGPDGEYRRYQAPRSTGRNTQSGRTIRFRRSPTSGRLTCWSCGELLAGHSIVDPTCYVAGIPSSSPIRARTIPAPTRKRIGL